MFSNDQNIETISQLVQTLKHYIGLQQEYVKLDVIDKVVVLLKACVIALIVAAFLAVILIFLSFAAAAALAPCVGQTVAWLIVAGVYTVLLILIIIFRKRWIERPLVSFLAGILLQK